MSGFREGFEHYARSSGGYLGTYEAEEWIERIDAAINKLQESLESYQGDGRSPDILGGYVAERWHAGTFNVDAAIKESGDYAFIPDASELGSVDVHLKSGTKFSLKYYKDAGSSLHEQAMTYGEKARRGSAEAAKAINSGNVSENELLYEGQRRLIPEDQLDAAREAALRKVSKEKVTRPEQAERYRRTEKQLTDVVENNEGVRSRGLSKQGSRDLARNAKAGDIDLEKYGISKQQLIQLEDIMKKALKTGMSAAVIGAVLEAAPALLDSLSRLVNTGEIDIESLQSAGVNALSGGARGFLTGGITAALVSSASSGALGELMQELSPAAVGAVALVAVNAVCNGVRVASGNMTAVEMADELTRDSFVASAALLLGGFAQALLPQLPVLGYMIGSFVGSAAAGLIYGGCKQAVVALCVDRGLTLFGLVDQDYELPEETLKEIGIDVFEYDRFMPDRFIPDIFVPDKFDPDMISSEGFELTLLRRGVIGVSKVGYVF